MKLFKTALFLALSTVSLPGCGAFVGEIRLLSTEPAIISLQAGKTIGQSFVARHAGLEGVEVFLAPEMPGSGEIRLHLRADSENSIDFAVSRLPVSTVTSPGFYRFSFTAQKDGQPDYYALLELIGEGKVRVGNTPGDSYLDGALYQDGKPVDAQVSFRLIYEPVLVMWRLAHEVMTWVGLLGIGIFLYVLPGWALLDLMGTRIAPLAWPEKLGLAAGLSLAIYPLLLLWTDLISLHLGAFYAWITAATALAVLLWRHRNWRPRGLTTSWQAWKSSDSFWPDLALLLLVALIFGVRFYVIRSLEVPLWGDSYHHTMIAQLLVSNGGLFQSWQPYAESQTLTYHFGFHAAVAAFYWISGLSMPQATLWVGQILNGLAVIALYPLAMRIGGNRWAGVGALLIAGLLAPMPMSYVNWGRYTQLAGQVILPAAICLSWAVLEAKTRDWRLIGLSWIVLGGLALTHYRILLCAVLFMAGFFILSCRRGQGRTLVTRLFILGIGGGLLFLPWFLHVFGGTIMASFVSQVTTPAEATSAWMKDYNTIGDMSSYLPPLLWLLMPLSAGLGLYKRQWGVALVGLWWFLILVAANPQWLHLPGQGTLSNFAVFIAAYIPASLFAGGALGALASDWQADRDSRKALIIVALVAMLGIWGARQRLNDLSLIQSALATHPDIRAAAWIRANTPQEARFLVNSFFAYGNSVIVGSDGGWWLPILTQRQTTLPPITYSMERGPRPNYREWVNLLSAEIAAKGVDHPHVLQLLEERGVTHVYVGQRQGRVNSNGPTLDPQQLLASRRFRPVYHQDRVWIFELVRKGLPIVEAIR